MVELVKNFSFESVEDLDVPTVQPSVVKRAPASEKVTLRLMRPDETVSLARLIYRVYGYTYPRGYLLP